MLITGRSATGCKGMILSLIGGEPQDCSVLRLASAQNPRARARKGEGARPNFEGSMVARIGETGPIRRHPSGANAAGTLDVKPSGHAASRSIPLPLSGSGSTADIVGTLGSGSLSPPASRSISRAASALACAATVPTPPRAV